jgi:hypothetical protein
MQIGFAARRGRLRLRRLRLNDGRLIWGFVDVVGFGGRYDENGLTRRLRFRRGNLQRVYWRVDPPRVLRLKQQYDGRRCGCRRCEHDRGEDESVGRSLQPAGFGVGLASG